MRPLESTVGGNIKAIFLVKENQKKCTLLLGVWRTNTSFTGNTSEAQLKLEQREFLMNKLQEQ